jgi:hypothetical protein
MKKVAIRPKIKLGLKFDKKLLPAIPVNCHLAKKEPLREYLRRAKSAGN